AFDQRAFGQAAPVMLLEHAEMDENVAVGLVADDEAEAARGVEPFDGAGDPEKRLFVRVLARHFVAPGKRGSPLGTRFPTRRHYPRSPSIRRSSYHGFHFCEP